jgi:hypothetical protein
MLDGNVSSGNVTLTALVSRSISQLNQTGKILHLISSTPQQYHHNKMKSQTMQLLSIANNKAYLATTTPMTTLATASRPN